MSFNYEDGRRDAAADIIRDVEAAGRAIRDWGLNYDHPSATIKHLTQKSARTRADEWEEAAHLIREKYL